MDKQPNDILKIIFGYVHPKYYLNMAKVSMRWKKIIDQYSFSLTKTMIDLNCYHFTQLLDQLDLSDAFFRVAIYLVQFAKYINAPIFLRYLIEHIPKNTRKDIIDEGPNSLLVNTIIINEIDAVKYIINKETTMNEQNLVHGFMKIFNSKQRFDIHFNNEYPLKVAIEHNAFEIVKILVSAGANLKYKPKRNNEIPMYLASEKSDGIDLFKFLLDSGIEYHDALPEFDEVCRRIIKNDNHKLILYCLEQNIYTVEFVKTKCLSSYYVSKSTINLKKVHFFVSMLENNIIDLSDIFFKEYIQRIISHICLTGDIDSAKAMLSNGYDFSKNNFQILIDSFKFGSEKLSKYLLSLVKVKKSPFISPKFTYPSGIRCTYLDYISTGDTLLEWAVVYNQIESIKIMLEMGLTYKMMSDDLPDENVILILLENNCKFHNTKKNPTDTKCLERIEEMLSSGANVHKDNDYALKWCVKHGLIRCVEYLLSHGASIDALDNHTMKRCIQHKHLIVLQYLLDNGLIFRPNFIRYSNDPKMHIILKYYLDKHSDMYQKYADEQSKIVSFKSLKEFI